MFFEKLLCVGYGVGTALSGVVFVLNPTLDNWTVATLAGFVTALLWRIIRLESRSTK